MPRDKRGDPHNRPPATGVALLLLLTAAAMSIPFAAAILAVHFLTPFGAFRTPGGLVGTLPLIVLIYVFWITISHFSDAFIRGALKATSPRFVEVMQTLAAAVVLCALYQLIFINVLACVVAATVSFVLSMIFFSLINDFL